MPGKESERIMSEKREWMVPCFLSVYAESQAEADKLAIQYAMDHTRQEDYAGIILDEYLPTRPITEEGACTMVGTIPGVSNPEDWR